MPFTAEQNAYIIKAHYRSATRGQNRKWLYSPSLCLDQFYEKYSHVIISRNSFIQHKNRIVKRFETKNCICKGKSTGRPSVLTQEVIENVRDRMGTKSIREIAAQTGLSYGSTRKACMACLKTTEKPFRCKVCLKSYATAQSLRRHFNNHNKERPYKCDLCSETFERKYHFTIHKFRGHNMFEEIDVKIEPDVVLDEIREGMNVDVKQEPEDIDQNRS